MRIWSFFLSVLLGVSLVINPSKASNLDSLKEALASTEGEERTSILHDMAYGLLFSNTEEAEAYILELIQYGHDNELYNGEARGYYLHGVYADFQGSYDLAVSRYKKALSILENHAPENEWTIWAVNNGLGMAYTRTGDYVLALEHLFKCIEASDKNKALPNKSYALLNIADVYREMKDYSNALKYFEESRKESEAIGNREGVAKSMHNMGLALKEMGEYAKALDAYREALIIKKEVGTKLSISTSYSSIGDVFMELGEYDSALTYLERSEELKKDLEDQWGLIFLDLVRSRVFIRKGEFDRAQKILNNALSQTTESANKGAVYDCFYELYKAKGDDAAALSWYIRLEDYEDSLINAAKNKQLAEMQTLYEVSQKESEIALLEKEREAERLTKNIYLMLGVSLLMLGGFVFYFFYSRNKKREELARIREEELKKEVDFKKKELASYTLNFVQKNSLLSDIKDHVGKLKNGEDTSQKELRAIDRIINDSIRIDKDWETFRMRFEEVHEGFFKALTSKYPALGPYDLKLCALIKLNMNAKEASQALGISPDSVKTARYRLRKKMELGKEDKLTMILASIENEV